MDRDSHSEDTLSTMVLENIKNKLIHAFRATGEPREAQDCSSAVRPVSIGSSYQANEELRRAQIDGAITWLRSELLEMRSQDLQLAQTLLGLNTEIQRLRRESFGGVEVEGVISSNHPQLRFPSLGKSEISREMLEAMADKEMAPMNSSKD